MGSSRLNQEERYLIHAHRRAGFSMRDIAQTLGRAASTVSRELRRNGDVTGYDPERAQRKSWQRRSQASRRPRIDADRINRIEALLAKDLSPEQIAGSTGLASHEWIYRHVYADQKRGGSLFRQLRKRRRHRHRRGLRDGRGQLLHRRHWSERPAIVETRARLGDWELDTIRASRGKAVVVSMTERVSRVHLLAHSPDGTAENVTRAIVGRLGKLRAHVHTLTSDNGKEFAHHQIIARALKADFFFADPHSPWQRGSNENANGLVRQYLPRSRDLSTVTRDELSQIETRLYTRPRKTLGFKTPLDVFEDFVSRVANQC